MATHEYCSDVGSELKIISDKLHSLSDKIDHLSSGEKQRMFDEVQGLQIIVTELDDRLDDLSTACSLVEKPTE